MRHVANEGEEFMNGVIGNSKSTSNSELILNPVKVLGPNYSVAESEGCVHCWLKGCQVLSGL
jgi:hypothetical protein